MATLWELSGERAHWLSASERSRLRTNMRRLNSEDIALRVRRRANLLAVWRVHGLDEILRRVEAGGVVLAGVSAGSICWFEAGTTDSFGPQPQAVTNGLGFLPYANGVHYDSEDRRRPVVHRLVADGTLGSTHCTDDGVGMLYRGTEFVEAVSELAGKRPTS